MMLNRPDNVTLSPECNTFLRHLPPDAYLAVLLGEADPVVLAASCEDVAELVAATTARLEGLIVLLGPERHGLAAELTRRTAAVQAEAARHVAATALDRSLARWRHDLRSPLGGVYGALSVIETSMGETMPAVPRRMLTVALESVERLTAALDGAEGTD